MERELLNAVNNNNPEEVLRLLENGANVHAGNDRALTIASEKGYSEIVRLLLENGADVHIGNDYALRWASENGYLDVLRVLLENGADVHAEDEWALKVAAKKGYSEIVRVLLEAGADVHAKNDYALRWASKNGHLEIVRLLLAVGANSYAANIDDIQNQEIRTLVMEYRLRRPVRAGNPRDAARAQEAKNEERRREALEEAKNKKEEKDMNNPMVEKLCMIKDTLRGDELKDEDDFVVFLLQNEGKEEKGECYLKNELEKIVENAPNISLWEGPPSGTIYNGPEYLAGEKLVPYPGKRKKGITNKVYKLPWTGIWVTNAAIQRAILSGDLILVLQGEKASIGSSHGLGNLHGQYGGHWGYLENNPEEAVYFEDGDFEPDERVMVYDVVDSYR